MKAETEKRLALVRTFLELMDKKGRDVTIELSVYGTPDATAADEAIKLFERKLHKQYEQHTGSYWIRLHNAPKGRGFMAANLRFTVFYPHGYVPKSKKKGGDENC